MSTNTPIAQPTDLDDPVLRAADEAAAMDSYVSRKALDPGAPVIRACDKKTGAVLSELSLPGMMGSMPMTYVANGKQYIAFTVGTPSEPAEVVSLALDK